MTAAARWERQIKAKINRLLANNFDEQLFGSGAAGSFQFSINATAVPEPNSLVLMSGVAAFGVLRRRRRASMNSHA
ncbi:PEP-CTERM sorting domain-containing protein [Rhodopirellula europaea]|uniref:PEP-CTERM sorting domain-containing protein n=1 Tax=Rhodopirellula europaea TaxID=1263866 RepID=UPI0005867BAD